VILEIQFVLTLDPQYVSTTERRFGLLGKTHHQLELVTTNPLTVNTSIESLLDGDYKGSTVVGKRRDRFIYFGLEQGGQWIRRWKLRHQQIDAIFNHAWTSDVVIHLLLTKDVTPVMSF
jgi:hypothetical protein